ncbi:15204_t:CDS:2, partial [Dentiscutata heterogama]
MSLNSFKDLAYSYEKLLQNKYNFDVIIRAGEGKSFKEIHAHSLILSARSSYFNAALSSNWAKKEGDYYIFVKPNIPANIFETILRHLDFSEAINILMAVDELLFQDATDRIIMYINHNLERFMRNDVVGVLQLVFQNEICEIFQEPCLHLICICPNRLFKNQKFIRLDKSILMLILQRDDLGSLKEFNLWKYLIKWGIGQNSNLQDKKFETWTDDDYIIMKNIINDFIPLIRWTRITLQELLQDLDHKMPTKVLKPRHLPSIYSYGRRIEGIKTYEELFNLNEMLLQNEKNYDVVIYAGEGNSLKVFHAHSFILYSRSSYFETSLFNKNYTKKIDTSKLDGPEILQLIDAANELELGKIIDYLLARDNFTEFVLSKLNNTEVLRLIIRIIELNYSLILQYESDFETILEKLNIDEILYLMKTDNRLEIKKFFDNILSSTEAINPFLSKLNGGKVLQLLVTANEFQYKKIVSNLLMNARTILGELNKYEIAQLMIVAKELKYNRITDRLFLSVDFTNIISDNLNCVEILDLLIIASQMHLQKFFNHLLNFIDQRLEEYMHIDTFIIVQIIFSNDAFKSLHDQCLHVICINPNLLFEHRKFTQLDKSILMRILQRDDLGMLSEISILDYLVKWGIAQNSSILPNQLRKWKKKDYDILEKTIHDFIPLIRWYQMSQDDFMRNFEFLKNILSKESILNYFRYNITPPQGTTILPQRYILPNHMFLAKPEQFDLIASWIDKKDLKNSSSINNEQISNEFLYYSSKNDPYDFRLLYCAKRDGFDAQIFHKLCDDKGPTVTLIKIMDIGLFGGYNELSWKSPELTKKITSRLTSDNNYLISDNNFLFYFNNKDDLNTSNISRVIKNCLAEKCYSLH